MNHSKQIFFSSIILKSTQIEKNAFKKSIFVHFDRIFFITALLLAHFNFLWAYNCCLIRGEQQLIMVVPGDKNCMPRKIGLWAKFHNISDNVNLRRTMLLGYLSCRSSVAQLLEKPMKENAVIEEKKLPLKPGLGK